MTDEQFSKIISLLTSIDTRLRRAEGQADIAAQLGQPGDPQRSVQCQGPIIWPALQDPFLQMGRIGDGLAPGRLG
jgi:hypothetical protein